LGNQSRYLKIAWDPKLEVLNTGGGLDKFQEKRASQRFEESNEKIKKVVGSRNRQKGGQVPA